MLWVGVRFFAPDRFAPSEIPCPAVKTDWLTYECGHDLERCAQVRHLVETKHDRVGQVVGEH